TAEIVALDRGAPPPRRAAPTLKERARQMSVYLEPPVYDQLRDLAFAERSKMHALMLEALDLLFKQRGARSIEQLSDDPPR
ncbi:ribbon-helix-helix domain-containing protein, partial [Methylobacterium trifolii]